MNLIDSDRANNVATMVSLLLTTIGLLISQGTTIPWGLILIVIGLTAFFVLRYYYIRIRWRTELSEMYWAIDDLIDYRMWQLLNEADKIGARQRRFLSKISSDGDMPEERWPRPTPWSERRDKKAEEMAPDWIISRLDLGVRRIQIPPTSETDVGTGLAE